MPAFWKRQYLLEGSDEELLPGGLPLLVSCNGLPVKSFRFEPAGFGFHAAVLRLLGLGGQVEDEQGLDCSVKEAAFSPSVDSFRFKGRRKSGAGQEQQDHYALLGLGHLRYLASEDQIRKCYREAALKHHPDKQAALILAEETEQAREAKKEEIDRHFKAIQEAYELLVDPVKRRIYDSTDEFDDAVPGDCSPEDFYKVYEPVFVRNGRWSVVLPVPSLGEEDSSLEEVDKFYSFWYSFKSWREFPHADEFDLEQAENREHKRWMERQNTKLREKAKKEENARIRDLVENAYKRDPRILKRKEEEKAEKLKRKQAKLQAKKDKEEEAARLLEEERLRKEEEERRAAEEATAQRKYKEKEKKLLRKERSRLRTLATAVVTDKLLDISGDEIDNLCASLEIEQLRSLCESLEEKDIQEQGQILRNALSTKGKHFSQAPHTETNGYVTEDKGIAKQEPGQGKPVIALNAEVKKEKPWSKQEVELLRKAVQKYPKGTSQRWEVVSNYIGTGRSVEEILKAVKVVILQKPDSSKAFDSFLERRKVTNVVISSPLSTRDGMQDGTAAYPFSAAANGAENDSKCKGKDGGSEGAVAVEALEKGGNQTFSNRVVNGTDVGREPEAWTDVQEVALIKALKAFPKDTSQRWERIAAAVPGKTKMQCYKKYVALKDNFRTNKGTQ